MSGVALRNPPLTLGNLVIADDLAKGFVVAIQSDTQVTSAILCDPYTGASHWFSTSGCYETIDPEQLARMWRNFLAKLAKDQSFRPLVARLSEIHPLLHYAQRERRGIHLLGFDASELALPRSTDLMSIYYQVCADSQLSVESGAGRMFFWLLFGR